MRAFVLFTSTLLASVLLRITWIANPYTFGGDESTYLVVAGRLLHGEVPYTTTFDNKPPLAELPQAISILVFGNSMVGVRIGAAIVLGIAAFLLSSAAFSTRFTWLRLPTAITIICTYTLIDQGAAWQAELNAILFFSLAAWSFTKRHSPYLIALFAGVIPLCRTNWILVTAVIVVFAILMPRPRPSRGIWLALLGLITPAASVVFVYLVLGKFDRLLQGAVILPMMRQEAGTFGLPFKWDKYLAASLLVLVFAIVLSSVLQQKKERFTDLYFLATMLALTVMALIQSPDFDHHSLQIVAFLPVALARLSLAASSTTRIRSNSRAKWLRFDCGPNHLDYARILFISARSEADFRHRLSSFNGSHERRSSSVPPRATEHQGSVVVADWRARLVIQARQSPDFATCLRSLPAVKSLHQGPFLWGRPGRYFVIQGPPQHESRHRRYRLVGLHK
jgi:hypothetical protein